MASPITVIKSHGIDITGDYVVNSISSTGNVSAGNIKSDHLLYANGTPYAFTTNAAGTNTQIQFNDGNSFAGSANLTFNKTTGTLTTNFFVGNGSQLTGLPASYTDTNANSAIDARVTKTFVDNLGINANTLNGHSDTYFATSTQGSLADSALQSGDNISELTNDAGYLVSANLSGYATESYVGNAVANLVNSAPGVLDTLGEIANALGNDASFTTTITNSLANKADTADLSTVALTGNYTDLNGLPTLFDGEYASLANTPTLFNGEYSALANKPTLFSGSYVDLTNKPSLFSGSYVDLTNKPTLGTAAATDSTDYATAAQGTKADTALQSADLNGYATETYVDGVVANITPTDLSSYATQTYVGNAIANLVASAPAALDTLNELANALGNDASYSTTITNALANKLSTSNFASTANTWISTQTTSNLSEGSNLYYTVARANTAIDNRVTKSFVDNLAVVANIANVAYSVTGANVAGQVANSLVAGTVYTNAQPNITSVGTLSSLAVSGSASIGTAQYGALAFDGTNGITTSLSSAEHAASWTVSFWMYIPTQTVNFPRGLFYTPFTSFSFVYGWNGGSNWRLGLTAPGMTYCDVNFSSPLTQNTWYFVSVSYNGNTVYIGLDGVVTSFSGRTISASGSGLTFGQNTQTDSYANSFGPHYLADVSVITGTALYTSNFTKPTTHPSQVAGQRLLLLTKTSSTFLKDEVSATDVSYVTATPTYYSGNPIAASGDIVSYANVTASYFIGNGSQLTGLPAGYTNTNANAAIDARVTKSFVDNLAVVANIANIAYSVSGSNVAGPVAYAAIANSVSGSNVVGDVSGAAHANIADVANSVSGSNVSGQVSNALVSGTVYTNAQPNITSVGTLTSLDVTGNMSAAYFIGNGSQLTGLPAGYFDSDVQTYLPTYTGNLSPSNLTVSASANLGDVANVTILGGTNGQLLSTDGNGVLSWASASSSSETSVALDSFTGDGANTAFTLSVSPANVNMITVNYNGSVLLKDSYSITGNVLTLGSAPFNGSKLEVISITNLTGSGGGSSGPSYTYTEVSANTTMVASTKYIVDTSTANITLTLPSTGTLGDEISVIDGTGNASSHAITIARNGGKIQGDASDMTVTTNRAAFTLVYYDTNQGWLLTNV